MTHTLDGNGCDAPSSETAKDMRDAVDVADIEAGVLACLQDLNDAAHLCEQDLLVIGASSSEVVGQRIGSATSLDIGRAIVRAAIRFAESTGCSLAFQCCEHLNRALVVTQRTAVARGLQEVTAIPVPGAGGAVAAVAFATLSDACLVSSVSADAGIDIGDTLIGMHLRPVAVPVRGRQSAIGRAHVVMARTRPPLIGGERAVYQQHVANERLR